MSDYVNKLKQEKKIELSRKISLSIAKDIWEKSLQIEDAQEFVDYLMTITDEQAIEEFFNQCHGEGGRFCGGGTASKGGKVGNRGPGTHIPAPIDYIKQTLGAEINTFRERRKSENVKGVTRGLSGGVLDAVIGVGHVSTVKIKKLQSADISKFSDKELGTVKRQLQADQRIYNTDRTVGLAHVLNLMPQTYAVARWKTKRIPTQIMRIDAQLAKKGKVSASLEEVLELAEGLTLEQEIELATKEPSGSEFKLSKAQITALAELYLAIEGDDDVPADVKKKIKAEFGQ